MSIFFIFETFSIPCNTHATKNVLYVYRAHAQCGRLKQVIMLFIRVFFIPRTYFKLVFNNFTDGFRCGNERFLMNVFVRLQIRKSNL